MPVTYAQAVEIVRDLFEPGWTHGTFCIDDRYITENDEFYIVSVGAREFLVDKDLSYAIIGGTSIVFKSDGRVESRASGELLTDQSLRERPNPAPTLKI